jgi:hypothetical protein
VHGSNLQFTAKFKMQEINMTLTHKIFLVLSSNIMMVGDVFLTKMYLKLR